ncbi:phosphocholine-specific phospholipase C [Pseudonocardia sp. CA-142604]|uniref:phosphocholine-specific phospholipase C n=1 Tax=Pseudonocardia sp. CA-142604 TaxID=3240024 RepID=UPI003D8D2123
MTALSRRRFVQLAGGTAVASMFSNSIARAAAIEPQHGTESIRDVEHIVILMQENRSFDHYYGSMRGVRGFGDPHPVTLPDGRSVWQQPHNSDDVLPFRPAIKDLGLQFIEDLDHSWNGTHAAWHEGKYDEWVPAKGTTTMAYLTRDDIPFHYALADAFTICDAYYCSMMAPTDPNRYHLWTGYVGNDGKGGGPVVTNDELGYGWTTYPERLEAAGISWKVYQDIGDGLTDEGKWGNIDDAYRGTYGDNPLLFFNQYRNAVPGQPLYEKARTGTNAKNGDGFFDVLSADIAAGAFPQVSWIVAPEAYSEHPNWPPNYGAWYIAKLLDALTRDSDVWSKTALLIPFDENDGFFDHMVPPYPPSSATQGKSTVDVSDELLGSSLPGQVPGPYGLGPRVPMLVVSPWSRGGRVCSEVFDHTSVLRFIEQRFGVREPNITAWRRTVCGDLTSAFDFSRADAGVPALPATNTYAPPDKNRHKDYVPTLPDNPMLPKQETGRRPALPLPYDLAADGCLTSGRLNLTFSNHGAAGASFYVTSTTDTNGPWTYTVSAGKQLSDDWTIAAADRGAYDFTVHGPNGFLRRLAGHTSNAGPEVSARHRSAGSEVQLVLTNSGARTVRLTVNDVNQTDQSAAYRIARGGRVVHTARTADSGGWYDLSVVSDGDGTFLRRLAGHVETGRTTMTDPAIGAR